MYVCIYVRSRVTASQVPSPQAAAESAWCRVSLPGRLHYLLTARSISSVHVLLIIQQTNSFMLRVLM